MNKFLNDVIKLYNSGSVVFHFVPFLSPELSDIKEVSLDLLPFKKYAKLDLKNARTRAHLKILH